MNLRKKNLAVVLLIILAVLATSCGVPSRKCIKANQLNQVLAANKNVTFLYGTYIRNFDILGAEGIRLWLYKYDAAGKPAPKGIPIEFRLGDKNKKDTFLVNLEPGRYMLLRVEYGSYDIPGFLARKRLNIQKEIEVKQSGISYLGHLDLQQIGYHRMLIVKFKNDFEADEQLMRKKYPQLKNMTLNKTELKESN